MAVDLKQLQADLIAQRDAAVAALPDLIDDQKAFWAKEAVVRDLDQKIAAAQRAAGHASRKHSVI